MTLVLGIGLISIPQDLVDWFIPNGAANEHFAIYLGTALIGFSLTNWLYSRGHDLTHMLPAVYGNLLSLVIASVIDIFALLNGSQNMALWLVLILHLFFASAFAYCIVVVHRNNGHWTTALNKLK